MEQVDVASTRLKDSILSSAEQEGLTHQAYWLSTTLALGAFLKVPPSPLPDCLLHTSPLPRRCQVRRVRA